MDTAIDSKKRFKSSRPIRACCAWRRWSDLPGAAADREERRADHDARRERDGDRRRRRQDTFDAGTTDPIGHGLARKAVFRGRGDQPGDPAGRSGRGARSTSSTCPRRTPSTPSAAPGIAGRRRSPRPARSTCSSASRTWATASKARSSCARRRCAREGPALGGAVDGASVKDDLQVVSTDHCPFDFHEQKELGRGDFHKVPDGLPGVEDRMDLLHDGGVIRGRITRERWVEIISTAPAKLFGMYPQKGAIAVGSTPTSSSTTRAGATRSRQHPPHGRRLLVLRGRALQGASAYRHQPGFRHRSRRGIHRTRGQAGSSSGHRRPRPDELTR